FGSGRRSHPTTPETSNGYRREAEVAESGPLAVGAGRSVLVPVSLLAAQGLSLLFGHGVDQFSLRGGFTFSTGLMPAWVTLIGAAIIEELSWHSYGTDTLVRKMRVFSASMLFTLIWALWHVPLSFIDGYYQNEVVESGVLATLNFPV